MPHPRAGERIIVELVATGDSYKGLVLAAGPDLTRIAVIPFRDHELPNPGSTVRVTFVRRDGLYEEHGTVIELLDSPDPELHVQLSGDVARTQRRDFVRKDASLNAEIEAPGRRMRCVTKDVSGGGVSLLFYELPPVVEGTEFAISLNLPDGRTPIRASCRAKHVREMLRGSRWLMGSQFADITDDDRQRIVRFVFRLELAQKKR